MTTLRQQNSAIVLTSTAKSAGQPAGVTLAGLQTQLDEHLAEAAILLKQTGNDNDVIFRFAALVTQVIVSEFRGDGPAFPAIIVL